jgi:hypothetical protein
MMLDSAAQIHIENINGERNLSIHGCRIESANMAGMKTLVGTMFIALLISANGCMTESAIHEAGGYPEMARSDLTQFGCPEDSSEPSGEPHPAYYALLPLTIPADIALYPFEDMAWFVNHP